MKVIITGATGFIGRNLAESFHREGIDVLATGRSQSVGEELKRQGIGFVPADIADADQTSAAIRPADCMIHCAALAGDWGKYEDFYNANVIGTRNVAEACRRQGISRIVFISTPSVYFSGRDRLEITESEPLPENQSTHYSSTKIVCEQELLGLRDSGFKTIILRPRAVIGPYDNIIIPRILRLASKKNLPLIDNGRALTDITYIDNLVDAVRLSLNAPSNAWDEIYNVCNGEPISIHDWFELVLEVFGKPFRPKNLSLAKARRIAGVMEFVSRLPFGPKRPALTRFSVGYMGTSMTMSIAKARDNLGYSPRIGNREGFESYAAWYQSQMQ